MLDFLMVCESKKFAKDGKTLVAVDIFPKFVIGKSEDLMVKGGDFYAIWCEDRKIWSTDEDDAKKLIDSEIAAMAKKYEDKDISLKVKYMWDNTSGVIDSFHKYCQKQMRDNFHDLDEQLVFSNSETKKTDYSSKRLPYPLEKGEPEAWNKLVSVLYSPEEKHKLEWCIGSIVNGDSKFIQKFAVLYGAQGTGKSTVLNVIQKLFEGYYCIFDAKALGSSNNAFALEAFASNPLVAIQHDGDLSRIEDNTRLNSLTSHESMTVNEKYKKLYTSRFNTFLFMGTNKPVKITDAKSGLLRRLIDITPSGNKVSKTEYEELVNNINFELGKIASQCAELYESDPTYYDDYVPINMMGASNDFFNFIEDNYLYFKNEEFVTLKSAWTLYKEWCDDAKVAYPFSLRVFKEELKNYFKEYYERGNTVDENRDKVRPYNCYIGFKTGAFEKQHKLDKKITENKGWINLKEQKSKIDILYADCQAQYSNSQGKPTQMWDDVKTTLKDLDTSLEHYIIPPKNHIVVDFDIKDNNGEKSLTANIEAASKFPKTYCEASKSGNGLHLHYIYNGNVEELSRLYAENIEIKIFVGKSSLRRKLTICNNLEVATISSGLPKKGVKNNVEDYRIKSERQLRGRIFKAINKEIHADTSSNVDFIFDSLQQAYNSGMVYDVTDLRNEVCAFAAGSTNQAERCLKLISKAHFKSDDISPVVIPKTDTERDVVFYDCEVFPNLFLVNWKKRGPDNPVVRMINPKPIDIEMLMKHKLVGFNCRKYDNHILYARLMGYSNESLFDLSQRIISKGQDCFFGDAYGISYTDIYDFCSTKQSLKKWEIELGIHHVELNLPWDKPVPEKLWNTVAEYCDNDVLATEATFEARQSDFRAREILANLSGLTVNDTNNQHTTRIIFGNNREPQSQFNYRFMGIPLEDVKKYIAQVPAMDCDWNYTVFDEQGRPLFPGYTYSKNEKGFYESWYRDELIGEGGYVYAEPGIYENVALLDVASMHPHSIKAENLFGEYTKDYVSILDARIHIKHHEYDEVRKMFNGKLAEYLDDDSKAEELADALKIPINSVYGLTSAKFKNPFKDPRNVDNIVAKRGALFMVNLKHEVQARGFTVAHIKTDSIKIPNATPEIIQFVNDYGKMYGYTFEHEATYEKMCLVNDAVYIAKYENPEKCEAQYGYIPSKNAKKYTKHNGWTATGKEFQVPYVFKTLFSHEDIDFYDMCETISVNSALYLDMNENLPNVEDKEKQLKKLIKSNPDDPEIDILKKEIENGHDYRFVGRVGQFCPVLKGGGKLCRKTDDGFAYAAGTKDYRWLDSESVRVLDDKNSNNQIIDISYYRQLVDDALADISQYGDAEAFVS